LQLALTAASPLHRGFVTDVDCRWNVISCSVDCRTKEERGLEPLQNDKFVIKKSRYDSIDSYLSPQGDKFNDVPLVYDPKVYQQLIDNDIDHLLAQHIAHLFIRDSVSLFSEKVHQNDEEDTDHFEVIVATEGNYSFLIFFLQFKNIQSTNWQTMRFKPPPPNSTIGWRVEFRPCEVQITDFENAAIVCFVVLLTRVILSYNLDFLIPISRVIRSVFFKAILYCLVDFKVDENMQNAQQRDACKEQKFWFRKEITTHISPPEANECCKIGTTNCEPQNCEVYTCMTVNEIVNGKVFC
jgi:glutamate--cysteine ligase catalytic subunit